jgi:nucleoside 2-deoxyribosyltransferase
MSQEKPIIYFAAPLFTQAEWRWNLELAQLLRARGLTIVLPQESAEAMLKGSAAFDAQSLFTRNCQSIRDADVVLAVLDGADPDSGTCWECGFAYAIGRPIIGLRTDFRGGGDDQIHNLNLMLSCGCKALVTASPPERDDLLCLAARLENVLRSLDQAVD